MNYQIFVQFLLAICIVFTTIFHADAQQSQRWPGYVDSNASRSAQVDSKSAKTGRARIPNSGAKSAKPEKRVQQPVLAKVAARPKQPNPSANSFQDSFVQQASFVQEEKLKATIQKQNVNVFGRKDAHNEQVANEEINPVETAGQEESEELDSLLALPKKGETRQDALQLPGGLSSIKDMGLSLGLVLAAFFGLVWFLKKSSGGNARGGLPHQVIQVLGRVPLDAKQQMQLVRLGDRILLIGISQQGTETLGEITDRDEVDAMLEICQSKNPSRIRESFRETLNRVRLNRQSQVSSSFSRTA